MKKTNNKTLDYLVLTALLFIAGICFIAFPSGSVDVVIRILGIIALAYTAYNVYILAIMTGGRGIMFATYLLLYIFTSVCSIVVIIAPDGAFEFLTLITGIYMAFDGFIGIYTLSIKRRLTGSKFAITLVDKIVTAVMGLYLIFSTENVKRLTAIILGVALIIVAASRLLNFIITKNSGFDVPFSNKGKSGYANRKDDYINGEFKDVSGDDNESEGK